jgi:hypothetical protein
MNAEDLQGDIAQIWARLDSDPRRIRYAIDHRDLDGLIGELLASIQRATQIRNLESKLSSLLGGGSEDSEPAGIRQPLRP